MQILKMLLIEHKDNVIFIKAKSKTFTKTVKSQVSERVLIFYEKSFGVTILKQFVLLN